MSFVGNLVGDVLGGITGTKQAGKGAEAAAATQAQAAQAGIAEQRRQFDKIIKLMRPYVQGGRRALLEQEKLVGLRTPRAQERAITGIEESPEFQALVQQGEEALLQSASATGGLRGGNLAGALAQYRPQMLARQIATQYGRLGGLTQLGEAAAAGQAGAGQAAGANIANLLGQQGAAQAGGQLAKAAVPGQTFGQLLNIAGTVAGLGGFGGFGGGGAGPVAPTATPTYIPSNFTLGYQGSGF